MMDKDPDPQHRDPEQYDGQGSGSTTQVSRTVCMMDKVPDLQHRYPEQYDGQGSGFATQVSRTV
jgi:hypothetical protein